MSLPGQMLRTVHERSNRPGAGALRALVVALCAAASGVAGGCSPAMWSGGGPADPSTATELDSSAALAGGPKFGGRRWASLMPDRLRILPLTRLATEGPGMTPAGKPRIICHVELLDRFGHGVKALGELRVELYRPRGASGEGGQTQELVWTVDLTDPEVNASYYDGLVARSYVVNLVGVPGWLAAWTTPGRVAPEGDAAEPFATLRATFIYRDASGAARRVSGAYRLTPGV